MISRALPRNAVVSPKSRPEGVARGITSGKNGLLAWASSRDDIRVKLLRRVGALLRDLGRLTPATVVFQPGATERPGEEAWVALYDPYEIEMRREYQGGPWGWTLLDPSDGTALDCSIEVFETRAACELAARERLRRLAVTDAA